MLQWGTRIEAPKVLTMECVQRLRDLPPCTPQAIGGIGLECSMVTFKSLGNVILSHMGDEDIVSTFRENLKLQVKLRI